MSTVKVVVRSAAKFHWKSGQATEKRKKNAPGSGEYPVTLAGVGRPVADPLCRVLARVAGAHTAVASGSG
jgi:hypothetical protein